MSGAKLSAMAWRNLWRNRRRTLLTLFSIAFGVFMAVMFTAMQDQNWADMIDLAARMGGGHVTGQHAEYLDTPTLTRTVEHADRLGRLALEHRYVDRAVQRVVGQTMLNTANESFGAAFIAFDPAAEDASTLAIADSIVEGEMFEDTKDKGIILGARLAENLGVKLGRKVVYTVTNREGDIVSGLGRVKAILRTGAPSVDGGLCLLPLGTLREVLGYADDEAIRVAIFISDQRRADRVAEGLSSQAGEGLSVLPWFEVQPELAAFIAMKVGGVRFMEGLLAVLVGAGIFNVLFVSVLERRREFGILLALGFRPRQIFRLIMLECLFLGLVGLVLAALLTVGPYSYLHSTGIDMSAMLGEGSAEVAGVAMSPVLKVGIYTENLVLIALGALAATLAAGAYPAWRAGRIAPVETIRLV